MHEATNASRCSPNGTGKASCRQVDPRRPARLRRASAAAASASGVGRFAGADVGDPGGGDEQEHDRADEQRIRDAAASRSGQRCGHGGPLSGHVESQLFDDVPHVARSGSSPRRPAASRRTCSSPARGASPCPGVAGRPGELPAAEREAAQVVAERRRLPGVPSSETSTARMPSPPSKAKPFEFDGRVRGYAAPRRRQREERAHVDPVDRDGDLGEGVGAFDRRWASAGCGRRASSRSRRTAWCRTSIRSSALTQ